MRLEAFPRGEHLKGTPVPGDPTQVGSGTACFFLTYEWAQLARVLYYTRLERYAREKHFTL